MKSTNGKLAGLEAISNSTGVIAAVAIDQQGLTEEDAEGEC